MSERQLELHAQIQRGRTKKRVVPILVSTGAVADGKMKVPEGPSPEMIGLARAYDIAIALGQGPTRAEDDPLSKQYIDKLPAPDFTPNWFKGAVQNAKKDAEADEAEQEKTAEDLDDEDSEKSEDTSDDQDDHGDDDDDFIGDDDDVCCICDKGGSLMQCYSSDGGTSCGKWVHPKCVGLTSAPEDDWVCEDCLEEDACTEEPGRATRTTKRTKLVAKRNSRKRKECRSDDEVSSEGSHFSDDFDGSSDSDVSLSLATTKTKKKSKKSTKMSKKPKQTKLKEHKKSKKAKKDDQKGQGWATRRAGDPPTSIRQQQDTMVRNKMISAFPRVITLQDQSIPASKRDDWKVETSADKVQERNEAHFPNNAHGLFCFTEQAPNDDGSGGAGFLLKPELRMFVGSKPMARWVAKQFQDEIDKNGESFAFTPRIFSNKQKYLDSFRSESAKKKAPPPMPSKSTIKVERFADNDTDDDSDATTGRL